MTSILIYTHMPLLLCPQLGNVAESFDTGYMCNHRMVLHVADDVLQDHT